MFIISKDEKTILNMDQINCIYIGADGYTIKADFANGKGCQLGRYQSDIATKEAIVILSQSIGTERTCHMPDDAYVASRINLDNQKNLVYQEKR